jgi:hypothetical protein
MSTQTDKPMIFSEAPIEALGMESEGHPRTAGAAVK